MRRSLAPGRRQVAPGARIGPRVRSLLHAPRPDPWFAALDIATGRVLAQGKKRPPDFLAFLRMIDREVPTDLDVHPVGDN